MSYFNLQMQTQIQDTYHHKAQRYQKQLKKLKQETNLLATVRLLWFVVGLIITFIFINQRESGWAMLSFFGMLGIFMILIKFHAQKKAQRNHIQQLVKINENEQKALAGEHDVFADGEAFASQEHNFTYDLDIFGKGSIFQFLNRTGTFIGKQKLANWLNKPSLEAQTIQKRQEASLSLKEKLDWRQHFLAKAYQSEDSDLDKKMMQKWLEMPSKFSENRTFKVLLLVLPMIATVLLAISILEILPVGWLFIAISVNFIITGVGIKNMIETHQHVSQAQKILNKYAELLLHIEAEKFDNPILADLQQKLRTQTQKTAGQAIKQIANYINYFENGVNILAGVFLNGMVLWNLQFAFRIEQWRHTYKEEVNIWFEVISEFDALISLANLAYNQPNYTKAEVVTDDFVLEAEDLGHVLLDEKIRVNNPVSFKGYGQLKLITGANMAGKSTYLRTVGINLILAMAGTVVCAKNFRFTPIEIYTSMRTKDSLQANESFFYAELKRLKMLIDTLSTGKKIFIILDEILKGTNSADQHTGSEALIRQIIKLGGVGLIATHDISLGTLEEEYQNNLENQCFEIEIKNDELSFDYKLRKGINQNLNATFLMKKMGITV